MKDYINNRKRKKVIKKTMRKNRPEVYWKKKAIKSKIIKVILIIIMVLIAIFIIKNTLSDIENKNIKKNEDKINEIVKEADIKTYEITVREKNNDVLTKGLELIPMINNLSNSMQIYRKDTLLSTNLIIAENNDKSNKLIDKFIIKRNKPYKIKIMETGASSILYEYGDYKVNTESKEFKKLIIDEHKL